MAMFGLTAKRDIRTTYVNVQNVYKLLGLSMRTFPSSILTKNLLHLNHPINLISKKRDNKTTPTIPVVEKLYQ